MSKLKLSTEHETGRGTMRSYGMGFALSLMLTLVAFGFVWVQVSSGGKAYPAMVVVSAVIVLAVLQFIVQLLFFLHLSRESKPRWNAMAFSFMALVLVILVFGSLWIMSNLNYNMMMSPSQIDQTVQKEEGITR